MKTLTTHSNLRAVSPEDQEDLLGAKGKRSVYGTADATAMPSPYALLKLASALLPAY